MPKIDFYILSENATDAHFKLACRLVEKAYKNQHRIYIHTANQTDTHRMDELLWTYRDDSFLPHNIYGDGPDPAPPIQIGFAVTPDKHRDILINLSSTIPEFYTQFIRVLEVVENNPTIQERARENYKIYRAKNYSITTHKL